MGMRKSSEHGSNESLKDEVISLFRMIFFNEWQEPRTLIILLWNQECFSRVSNDDVFKNLFKKVKDSFYTKYKVLPSTGSTNPSAKLKIIKSGQKSAKTHSIFVDFKKLKIITTFIGDLLENIDSKELESIIENHFKRYRSEFIHGLTIKILFLLRILKGDLMRKMESEKNRESIENVLFTFKGNHNILDFLKLDIQNPEEMKGYLNLFLKGWKKFYPDQCKTNVDNIADSKKVSMLEAIKLLEEEITEQFNNLVDTYQNFPNPFVIYTFWEIPNVNEVLKDIKEDTFIVSQRNYPEFWAWSKKSRYPPEVIDTNETYFMAGLIFKKDVNWPLTIMKNCELTYGLYEKEIILFQGTEIKIVKIE